MKRSIITFLSLTITTFAFWPAGGVKVVQMAEDIENIQSVYLNDGSVVVSWEKEINPSIFHIYCQKIDTTGSIHWDTEGVRVCLSDSSQKGHHLVTDGEDAYFSWPDKRSDNGDIYAQKISGSTGQRVWGEQGVPACIKTGLQYVCDGTILDNGYFAVTWFNLIADPYAVEAQLLDVNGVTQWGNEGISVSGKSIGGTPRVLPSGNALLDVWTGIRAEDTSGAYLAQRVDSDGNFLWDSLGVLIEYALSFEGVCSDEAGGAIVLFKKGSGPYYTQRIDSSGQKLWQEGGVPILINQSVLGENHLESPTPTGESERFISDGMGGLFIHWGELVQHIDSSGHRKWYNPGVVFWERSDENTFMDDPNLCVDGSGGTFVVFGTIGDPYAHIPQGIFVQRVSASGEVMFGPKGATVWLETNASISIGQAIPGGVICVWLDTRNSPDVSIYAQIVDTTGKVGSGIEEELQPISYPVLEVISSINSGNVILKYALSAEEEANLKLFEITGRLIQSQTLNQREGVITLNIRDLPSGVYYVQLSTQTNKRTSRKVLVIH